MSKENRYYITGMAGSTLEAKKWRDLIRRHWSGANYGHNPWDKLLQEDGRLWVKLPRGMVRVMAPRRIAYNRLALHRDAVRLKKDEAVPSNTLDPSSSTQRAAKSARRPAWVDGGRACSLQGDAVERRCLSPPQE